MDFALQVRGLYGDSSQPVWIELAITCSEKNLLMKSGVASRDGRYVKFYFLRSNIYTTEIAKAKSLVLFYCGAGEPISVQRMEHC